MAISLFSHYTNRVTSRTIVMHGTQLCGYVDKVADNERTRGFYYAVSVCKGNDVAPSYCASDRFGDNVAHVKAEWLDARSA